MLEWLAFLSTMPGRKEDPMWMHFDEAIKGAGKTGYKATCKSCGKVVIIHDIESINYICVNYLDVSIR